MRTLQAVRKWGALQQESGWPSTAVVVLLLLKLSLGERNAERQGDAWCGSKLARVLAARLHLRVRAAAGRRRADHAAEM